MIAETPILDIILKLSLFMLCCGAFAFLLAASFDMFSDLKEKKRHEEKDIDKG